jgi:serine protease Do
VRYSYGIAAALLTGGAAVSLITGQPAGAQVAQNDERQISNVVPRAGAPASFADLTAQLQPAVVNISTRQKITISQSNPFAGTPFEDLFGNQGGGGNGQPISREAQSLGSGFFISADGYIVTNHHVITAENGGKVEEITVTTADGTDYPATVVGDDAQSDLAVLKIKANKAFPFVKFGDSRSARVGDWVIAIGDPFGLGTSVTSGIVSAVLRSLDGGAYSRYLQTDASINRGNSGGPLFDMKGDVIGINDAIYSPTGGSVGVGFAIPSEIAQPIVERLMSGQPVLHGYLGVRIQDITDEFAGALGIPKNRGSYIQSVEPGGPAEKAGLKVGDVVTSVNGKEVTQDQSLSYLVNNLQPGARVPLTVLRDGKTLTVTATIAKRPSDAELAQQTFNPNDKSPSPAQGQSGTGVLEKSLGISVIPLTPTIAGQLGLDQSTRGLVITQVDPSSDAAQSGLDRAMVIVSANGQPVATTAQLEAVVKAAQAANRTAVLLRVQARGAPAVTVPVRLR